MKYKNNYVDFERKRLNWLWILVVFLLAFNLFGQQNLLVIITIIVGILIGAYKKNGFSFSVELGLLYAFSFTYFIIYSYNNSPGFYSFFLFFLIPPTMFIIGSFVVKYENRFIKHTIYAILIGMFLHGSFNMYLYLQEFGNDSLQRSVQDVWSGVYMAATLQGTYFTPIVSLFFYAVFLLINKKRIASFILFAGILFSVYTSLLLGNRTLILLAMLIFITSILLYFLIEKRNTIVKSQLTIILIVIISLSIITYTFNLFNLQEFILNSNFYSRMEKSSISEDSRFETYRIILSQLLEYPFGGHVIPLKYAHNLWLDVLLITGLIPFFILLLYTIKTVINLFYVIKHPKVDTGFKLLVFSIYGAFLLNFMVEPILEGVPFMFLLFCLINGMIKKYSDGLKV